MARQIRLQDELDKIRTSLRDKKPASALVQNYRKDGSMFWNQIRISPMADEHGQVTHFVSVLTSILGDETRLR